MSVSRSSHEERGLKCIGEIAYRYYWPGRSSHEECGLKFQPIHLRVERRQGAANVLECRQCGDEVLERSVRVAALAEVELVENFILLDAVLGSLVTCAANRVLQLRYHRAAVLDLPECLVNLFQCVHSDSPFTV